MPATPLFPPPPPFPPLAPPVFVCTVKPPKNSQLDGLIWAASSTTRFRCCDWILTVRWYEGLMKKTSNLLNSFPSLVLRNHENCFQSKLVKKSFVQVCISNLWICSECSWYSMLRTNLNKVSVKKTTTAWKDITHRSKITAVCELLEIQAHSKWFLVSQHTVYCVGSTHYKSKD